MWRQWANLGDGSILVMGQMSKAVKEAGLCHKLSDRGAQEAGLGHEVSDRGLVLWGWFDIASSSGMHLPNG